MENENIEKLFREHFFNRDLSVKPTDRYISSFKNVIKGTINVDLNILQLGQIPTQEIALNYITVYVRYVVLHYVVYHYVVYLYVV